MESASRNGKYPIKRITWLRDVYAPRAQKTLEKHWRGRTPIYLSYKIQSNYVWWELNHWHVTTGYYIKVLLDLLVTRHKLSKATKTFMSWYETPKHPTHLIDRVGDAYQGCSTVGHGRSHPGQCPVGNIPAKVWSSSF